MEERYQNIEKRRINCFIRDTGVLFYAMKYTWYAWELQLRIALIFAFFQKNRLDQMESSSQCCRYTFWFKFCWSRKL